MKILELTNFSAGICGVWQRVKQESELLSKNHEVQIMSSNWVNGSEEKAKSSDKIGKIKISRFPATKLGGEGFLYWNFEKYALDFEPDIIIAHSYRIPHTTKALKVAKKLSKKKKVKIFLVTHAPFVEGNITRSLPAKISVIIYDKIIGPRTINKFDKVIAISKWELPYLKDLGCKKEKIVYIPNGIPEEFFTQKKSKQEEKILFLGRIAPIKNLEVLVKAMKCIKNKKVKLEIVGPAEKEYLSHIKKLIKSQGLENTIEFIGPIYDIKEKIKKIDSSKIFVLPSKREAMPQTLIEAMSRGKVVIASKNPGTLDLIKDGENGLLFDKDSPQELAEKIDSLSGNQIEKKLQTNAKKSSEKFKWSKIIKDLEACFFNYKSF
jgi:glycosyltransferase involved in cell wall biosynthesis